MSACTDAFCTESTHASGAGLNRAPPRGRHGSTVRQIPGARRNILLSYGPDREDAWEAPPDVFARLGAAARALIAAEPAEGSRDWGGQVGEPAGGAPAGPKL